MSGPIVRTGATPEFWKNWDSIFGGKKKGGTNPSAKSKGAKPAAKAAAKPAKKKAAKKK
jgi:hypothetical protein